MSFYIQNYSSEVTLNSVFKRAKSMGLKISKDTVYDYTSKLEDTAYFFFIDRFSSKAHLRESYPKKVYLCDTALAKTVRFFEDKEKLMENCVFLELLRQRNTSPSLEIHYWNSGVNEVDFVLRVGGKVEELLQVTYADSLNNVHTREIDALLKASRELKPKKLTVITWNAEGQKQFGDKKIVFTPLWKWLLGWQTLNR
jgi:predicted AAA+ superfamily ATPase